MAKALLVAMLSALSTSAGGAQEVALGDLEISHISTGWGTVSTDRSAGGQPLKIGDQAFAHGVGVHAPSVGLVQLDGRARSFRAKVGVNADHQAGEVEFVIRGDGKVLWRSGVMDGRQPAKEVDVPLVGVRRLVLEVDPCEGIDHDHADWAEAVIAFDGARPRMLAREDLLEPPELYPPQDRLVASPGGTSYFVDPARGDDANSGTRRNRPWKSIARANALKLAPGDSMTIAPGFHAETLKPSGAGTALKPLVIRFAPGRHEFGGDGMLRRAYYVSNANDRPTVPRPIGILVERVKHLRIQGGGVRGDGRTDIVFTDRMIEFINDHSEDIVYSGLTFDLARPTVSEFRVLEVEGKSVVIRVAEGSTYAIENGVFKWTGDIGSGWTMAQQANLENGHCWRMGEWDPFSSARAEPLGDRKVRLTYESVNTEMRKGRQFQFRNVERDNVSAHNNRCRDVAFRDCRFHMLPGMGIVSQFTENITFQRVDVMPPEDTLRTCAAWADGFHFSGCRGDILLEECRFSGMQDDPINVHGTHLRIIARTGADQLLLRFMHGQTYGFAAFQPGDEVAVISHSTLRELPGNPRRKVTAVAPKPDNKSGREWLVTLDGPVPAFGENDVLDNITWYPNVTARNCHVTMDSCRGFLVTTRGKVLVEGNTFNRCSMPAILVEDNAEGWFESGPVRDMTIRDNSFIGCGIAISPQETSRSRPTSPFTRISASRATSSTAAASRRRA